MDGWDWALLAIAGYISVMALTRLMLAHRDQLLDEFRRNLEDELRQRQQKAAEAKARSKSRDRAA